jgi:hypothetical protein
MSNNTKKYTVVIVLGLAIVAAGVFSFLYQSLKPVSTQLQGEWLTYHDPRYYFSIDYPSDFSVDIKEEEIDFREGETSLISVTVERTGIATTEEFLESHAELLRTVPKEDLFLGNMVIDSTTTIDGHLGVVMHDPDSIDHTPRVLLIRYGYVFSIVDRTNNPKRTWDSFHFEELPPLPLTVEVPPDWTTFVLTVINGGIPSVSFESPRIDLNDPFYELNVSETSKEEYLDSIDSCERFCKNFRKELVSLKDEKIEMYASYYEEGINATKSHFFERAGKYYNFDFSEYDHSRDFQAHTELSEKAKKISSELFSSVQFEE